MLPVLVIGIVVAVSVTVAVAVFHRTPTRARCPECEGETKIVLLPPVLRQNEFVHLRWCPRCEWEGLGRNGPEWVPGKRLAHGSGFHWGDARLLPDFGFRFRRGEVSQKLPPHHPSGFRFSEDPTSETTPAHHPSGFRFSDDSDDRVGRPAVFRWAEERSGGGFSFGRPRPSKRKSGGFTWRGVA